MNKRFKPSKDTLIAILSALTIASTSIVALQERSIKDKDNKITKLERTHKDYKSNTEKELKLRDEVLEQYRNKLDKNDATIKEKDEEINKLQKQLSSKENPTRNTIAKASSNKKKGSPVELTLTFYGDGAHENGGYANMTAYGEVPVAGVVASNAYPKGTQFLFPNGQVFTVKDRGGSSFNNYNRLDVFVPRLKGESDAQYDKRIRTYGVKKIKAYKIN